MLTCLDRDDVDRDVRGGLRRTRDGAEQPHVAVSAIADVAGGFRDRSARVDPLFAKTRAGESDMPSEKEVVGCFDDVVGESEQLVDLHLAAIGRGRAGAGSPGRRRRV